MRSRAPVPPPPDDRNRVFSLPVDKRDSCSFVLCFFFLLKGRLDYNTEGLLLLTNDGDLARLMELPSSDIVRTYSVRVYGNVSPTFQPCLCTPEPWRWCR